jgi:hypothetical protein
LVFSQQAKAKTGDLGYRPGEISERIDLCSLMIFVGVRPGDQIFRKKETALSCCAARRPLLIIIHDAYST